MKWSATKAIPNNEPGTGRGINLCFGRHSGYGGYADWARGARHIVIEEDKLGKNELETWIRLEDGSISGRVTLNATYGTDKYPAVRQRKSKSRPLTNESATSGTKSSQPTPTAKDKDK